MAQNTTWKHVGGAPYAGTDSAAIWSAPNVPSSVKAHLWDLWVTGANEKVKIPRGYVLAVVNNRGGWTLRNVTCAWETPERFTSLPAYEVSWQEGAVNYRLGKFSRDLNARNCGNWYVVIEYRRPQATPAQPTQQSAKYVSIHNYGGIVITGNGNTVTVTLPQSTPSTQSGSEESSASSETESLLDRLDLYTGLHRTTLSNGPHFDVGYIGLEVKVWGPIGIFGEVGMGRDTQNRTGFPLPVRSEYRSGGLRVQVFEKGLFSASATGSIGYVGDEIRMGDSKLDIRAGESYQSAQTLLGVSARLQYGPLFLEGSVAGFGDYINVNNQPKDISSTSLAIGISGQGIIETIKRFF